VNSKNNISEAQLERIDRYLSQSMSPEEQRKFDNEMQGDPGFRQQVEEVKHLILGIESASLKHELDQFHEDLVPVRSLDQSGEQRTIKLKRFQKIIRYVAAAVVILGFAGYLIVNSSPSSEKLFAQHFTPDPGLPTTMGSTDNFEFYDAMVNYKQEEYAVAIEKWQTLYNSNRKSDTLTYFLGVAHLAKGNEKEAINYLQELSNASQNSFKSETYYYLGLAYLKANNVEEAKKSLTFSGTERANRVLSDLND
jgi:tetratricopeptide (TPR) repeat protein